MKLPSDFPGGSNPVYILTNLLAYSWSYVSTLKYVYFHEVFKECQESWKAIVIDEFQDTSAMQYGLLQLLSSHKRITIVGDEDQVYFYVS